MLPLKFTNFGTSCLHSVHYIEYQGHITNIAESTGMLRVADKDC